ncbi:MAG: chloride channel protein [Planctomycetes bacterium]|nr:chloride channel protein [Planctomycetota bacterium]
MAKLRFPPTPRFLDKQPVQRVFPNALRPLHVTIALSALVGILAGYGAALFSFLIESITHLTLSSAVGAAEQHYAGWIFVLLTPIGGLLAVAWFTRRFAPEAEGHGVPEVITAVARHDGRIRPRVAVVKILASGVSIGTGGSVGREGPIVQIGATLGSMAGQYFGLSPRYIKVLLAAGGAAGISATFNAPLAGVIFASEIILGSFAVESLTPIVVASVLANVVQVHVGEHGLEAAFPRVLHRFEGAWEQLPLFIVLGIACGLMAVGFTKLLYFVEDLGRRYVPRWWHRAVLAGALVGLAGVLYPVASPVLSSAARREIARHGHLLPPLMGVGYSVVDHSLRLQDASKPSPVERAEMTPLSRGQMVRELMWLLPLALLKPLMTSITLSGGGSGGIFAPSLFIGATLGAAFGLGANLLAPGVAAHPGAYAIVGMGAVVAGTTHGVLSAILVVYEMTDDYNIILPIMVAAGIASVVAQLIDPESIYYKKLSRRGEFIARGHDLHPLEHVMVRDVMIRDFPTVRNTDNAAKIVRVARENSHIETLPVLDQHDKLVGIIRAEDLHRILDSDVSPYLVNAEDIAMMLPIAVPPYANLLEALRDFGVRDIETLPVEAGQGEARHLVGLLLRSDVMRRYREELLR